ncbi:ATP-binding protein [Halomonas piscis]|uniref:histidine kinase n=1 Tax=Halomonas piscis TaxID=3031727 RepID=A0ABY9YZ46_9GAMM|nr:ATP-binding protein [Halomonas piscis]WNK19615.1 ATP-binding protein [Halomonas piscis]
MGNTFCHARYRRLSRLGIKLFAIILSINVVIAGAVFLAVSYSIDRGFLDYLNQAQERRAMRLAEGLVERWQEHQSWEWLASDPLRWPTIVYHELGRGNAERPSPLGEAQDFALRAPDGRFIVAPRHAEDEPASWHWMSLDADDRPIGSLGFRPPQQILKRMENRFLDRQRNNLSLIVISLGVASLLLAGCLSWWLGRRAHTLATGAMRLTRGDYHIRLPVRGRDELSRLARDFNVLASTLEANRNARARWVSDTAHELRTPLAVLRGEIEAMQDGIRPLDTDSLGSLGQEVEQLECLVADLRLLSQSDAGALAIQLAPLDLSDHLQCHLNDARRWLEDTEFRLTDDLAPSLHIYGDAQRLRQLWHNLLDNSRAYTREPGTLSVTLTREHNEAALIWEDSAPGVPQHELARLTERLYRVEGSRSRSSGGSGLGLSIVSALVHAHDGRLDASASPLGGLRWTLRFPLISST